MSSARVTRNRAEHSSVKFYTTGFLLALVLTVIPFWLVMTKAAPASFLVVAILALGAVQMLVHLRYFLHIDASTDGHWNMIALGLAVAVAAIVVVGSLWVIYDLNSQMMPHMTMAGG
jgi:cytochrome o ubiquinol oxidase subunit IV